MMVTEQMVWAMHRSREIPHGCTTARATPISINGVDTTYDVVRYAGYYYVHHDADPATENREYYGAGHRTFRAAVDQLMLLWRSGNYEAYGTR